MKEFFFRKVEWLGPWEIVCVSPWRMIPYNENYPTQEYNWSENCLHDTTEVFQEWLGLTSVERKKYFQQYSQIPDINCNSCYFTGINFKISEKVKMKIFDDVFIPLVSIPGETQKAGLASVQPQKKKKGSTMFNDDLDDFTETTQQGFSPEKRYLLNRVDQVANEQRDAVYATYHMTDPGGPTTLKDMIKRLTEGKYTFRSKDYDDTTEFYYLGDILSWRTEQPDKKGYEKACNAIADEAIKVRDEIVIGDLEAAGAALRKFESKKF